MLLVIDVGNTNITLGVFDKEELFGTFRMKTKQPRTSDEYGITLQELVERHGIESSKINAVIIASVVPDVMHSLGSAIIKYFGVKPVVVSAGIKTGIRIVTENPRQVVRTACRCQSVRILIRRSNNCLWIWNSNNI